MRLTNSSSFRKGYQPLLHFHVLCLLSENHFLGLQFMTNIMKVHADFRFLINSLNLSVNANLSYLLNV